MAGGCLSDLIPLTNRIFLTSVTRFYLWISEKSQHSLGLLRLHVFISWPESSCHQRYCWGSLPDGSGVKNLLASAGRHRFNPWSGKISHAMKKLSMWATTTELVCALEPGSHSYWSSCPLEPATRGATAMSSPFPCLLHTEQKQQRPNIANVNKQKFKRYCLSMIVFTLSNLLFIKFLQVSKIKEFGDIILALISAELQERNLFFYLNILFCIGV